MDRTQWVGKIGRVQEAQVREAYYEAFDSSSQGVQPNLLLVVDGAISACAAVIYLLIGGATLFVLGLQATGFSPLLSVGLGTIAVFV